MVVGGNGYRRAKLARTPRAQNFGWLLKNADETDKTDFRAFWSAQGAAADNNSSIAPSLTVTYSVPEPGSLLMIAAGIPLLLRRSRR